MSTPGSYSNDRAAWLKGPGHRCSEAPARGKRVWRLVLLGPPGVGKGTQAQLLCDELGSCHLSTGDVFRAARSMEMDKASPAMVTAIECMVGGKLVPDLTVVNLVKERAKCLRCVGGFLLDGFPRTAAQAGSLEEILQSQGVTLNAALYFELPLEQLRTRLSGRRTCGRCKAVYHVANRASAVAGVCDTCGGDLVQREDDREEAIEKRMVAYNLTMEPLLTFYAERKLLMRISAAGSPDQVFTRVKVALGLPIHE